MDVLNTTSQTRSVSEPKPSPQYSLPVESTSFLLFTLSILSSLRKLSLSIYP